MKKSYFLIIVFAFACCHAQTDDLPRRGLLGLEVVSKDTSQPPDPKQNPLTVNRIIPDGAGEAAGIEAGDTVRAIDGAPVFRPGDFVDAISHHLAGDRMTIKLLRNGQKLTKTVTLKPRPYETSADADVLYRSVTAGGTRRRVIITRPKAPGRYPAVMILGGLGCYSLDGALNSNRGYGPILTMLAKNNFVTMRVEKTGEGDSEGPACTDRKATAELEAAGYVAGLRLMKTYDFVDSAKIFIFAHSLGPLLGSVVVPQEPVRGFIAAETIGRSWFEYMLENVRRQFALVGKPLDEVDAAVREHEPCNFHFFVLHESAENVSRLGKPCADMVSSYGGVPETYMHQIGDLSLAKQWKQADIPVLVVYGSSDPATSADESRYLVEIINSFHPGRATYVEIPGMAHDFSRYASQAEFLTRSRGAPPHPFDDDLLPILLKWLQERLHD
jgi:pimeloyl-ACP methyl ester carboxylesterase